MSAVRVPPLPPNSKVFRGKKGNKQPKTDDMLAQQPPCSVNGAYYYQKLGTPSSSVDTPDNHHCKASSSDSSYSKDEATDLPGEIRYRQPSSQISAMTCFNFDATNQDEISFKRGSKVYVKKSHPHDDQYVYVKLDNGKEGYAPKQFLQPVGRTPPIINAYEVEREDKPIGEGSFSKVYVAMYKGEKCALKEYKEACFEKAKEEAECLNAMDHVNIVKVVGLCRHPVFMLMEFCEGGQLATLIKRRNFNPPLRVLINWALQIAEGLRYMHNQEIPICHSDIKPSNIMIKEMPCNCENINYFHEDSDFCSVCGFRRLSRLTMKLTDFGLAKPTSAKANSRHSLVGSIPYMAPEYIREVKMTPKADVWSFGVLFGELLTKEAPYHDATNDEAAAIMMGIGKGVLKPMIPNNCSGELAALLTKCWEPHDDARPTMNEVIEIIKKMPRTDPEYIMICETKQPSAKSVVEFLKTKFNIKADIPEKPSPPKRKGKNVTKNDISHPTDFRPVLSIQPEGNNKFTVHDYISDERQRHPSSHDYGQGTLPRTGVRAMNLGASHVSTPDLTLDSDETMKLGRTYAVRRKQGGKGGDQAVISACLTNVDDSPASTLGPISASTPIPAEPSYDANTIQVVNDFDLASVSARQKTSRESQREHGYSPKRSPSSSSNSTFYVSKSGDAVVTPTYDTSTIKSESSIESTSKKSKSILKNMNPFRRKSQEHDVCYDPTTKKYHNLNPSRQISQNDESTVSVLSPAPQMQKIPLLTCNNEGNVGRYTKAQDSSYAQRVRKMTEHKKNPSNGSDKIELGRKTPPFKQHGEGGLTPPTPKNFPSSMSPGNTSALSTVLPFPSPTTPGSIEDSIKKRTNSYVELRRNTTESPVENGSYIPLPIVHSRSKSNDSHAKEEVQKELLNSLAHRLNKGEKQTVVENRGYHKFEPSERNRSQSNVSTLDPTDGHHYKSLKNSVPVIPPRRTNENNEAPPRPPRNNMLSTVIEYPKSPAPIIPARSYGNNIGTPNYLSLDPGRSQSSSPISPGSTISLSSPGYSLDYVLPSSTAPVLPRPDSLDLERPRGAGIQRGNQYVQLQTNFRTDNGASDVHSNRVPNIPMNIPRH